MARNILKKSTSGYTLLEVTIALIIIGISLTALFGELSRSKSLSFKSDTMLESVRILHNLTEDPVLMKKALKEGEGEGHVPGEKGWLYSFKAAPLEIQLKSKNEPVQMGSDKADSVYKDEPVEIPGMKSLKICIKKDKDNHNREYCITRWYNAR